MFNPKNHRWQELASLRKLAESVKTFPEGSKFVYWNGTVPMFPSGESVARAINYFTQEDLEWARANMNSLPRQAHEFLEAGLGHMKDRAATYDAPQGERSMGKTVDMFRALTGIEMTEEQGWKFMCCLKLVRSEQGDFRADNFEDLAAYAGLAGEAAGK